METTTKEAELEKEVNSLKEDVKELEQDEPFVIDGSPYDNLRGKMVFEKLFNNLDYLPIDELETLVQKHAVL